MATKKKVTRKKSTVPKGCKSKTFKSSVQAKAYAAGVNAGKKSRPAKVNPKKKTQVIICK